MTDQEVVEQAPANAEPTAADLLKQIEDQQRQLDARESVEPEQPQQTEQVSEPNADKPSESEATSAPEDTPAPDKDKAALEAMKKKKGFKTTSDFIKSYENMEREYTRSRMESRKQEGQAQPETPWAPMPYGPQTYSRYTPPPPSIEDVAQRYKTAPDDFERVFAIANDITTLRMKQEVEPLVKELKDTRRQIQRQDEKQRLQGDPVFQNPDVREEMDAVLKNNPSLFDRPDTLTEAFNQALINLARRQVAQSSVQNGSFDGSSGSAGHRPPPAGSGSSGAPKGIAVKSALASMTPEEFNRLSAAEMEKVLRRANAFKSDGY